MKRPFALFSLFLVVSLFVQNSHAAHASKGARHQSSGEVTSVDSLYSRISILHPAIKGFSGDTTTEFTVSSKDLLKNINKFDLVDFEFVDEQGEAKIDNIKKTGVAPPKEEGLPVGKAVQGVLESAGQVAKGVTSPVTPVNEVVSAATDATTGATGAVLNEASPDVKKKF